MSPRPGLVAEAGAAARARITLGAVLAAARWTPYLESEMLGLPELVRPGSVCVDVGAAAGLYTLALSRLAGPSGRVLSVEPLSFARPMWARVLRARDAGNVSWRSIALGAEPGSAMMSVPVGKYGPVTGRSFLERGSFGIGSNAEFQDQIEVSVQVQTLDGLCTEAAITRLDFVKIDVEGAELQVLEGGREMIEKFRPAMQIEIEDRHMARYRQDAAEIVAWVTGRGYRMYTWDRGWHPADRVRADTRNYLFRPSR
jgi:FkbM family methyltransferase